MRKWGIIITIFYALVLVALILPGFIMLAEKPPSWYNALLLIYSNWCVWVWIAILVGGQAVLLLVSVDSSWKRLKPRQHILVSVVTVAILVGVLSFAAAWSLLAGVLGDKVFESPFEVLINSEAKVLGWWFIFWLLWGVAFLLYVKGIPQRAARLVGWLL